MISQVKKNIYNIVSVLLLFTKMKYTCILYTSSFAFSIKDFFSCFCLCLSTYEKS